MLGIFSLEYDGIPYTGLDSVRQQELLAWLLLNRKTPQPRRQIAFQFWPDSSERQAQTNLRNLLHKTRRSLPDADTYLLIDHATIQWNTGSPYSLDVADFEESVLQAKKAATEGDTEQQILFLRKAAKLYRDDLLKNCYKKWIDRERSRLKTDYLTVLHSLIRRLEQERLYLDAIPFAQNLVACDEYDEASYRKLMELYLLTGNKPQALQTYQDCENILRNELQIEPARKTKQLYEELQSVNLPITEPSPETNNHDSDLARHNRAAILSGSTGTRFDPALRSKKGVASLATGIILLVLVAFGLFSLLNSPPAPPDNSLAVLPLKSINKNPEDLKFTEDVHEELTNRLAGIKDLKVISRNSVLGFSAGERDLRQIGEDLGVSSLLEGTVHRTGDRFRVSVQLIDVNSLANTWSGHYEEHIDAVFAIQSRITQEVAEELQASLTEEQQKRLEERPTNNLQALSLYMKAREHLSHSVFDKENLRTAEALFRRALEKDPQFTHAWAMLSVTYSYLYSLHGKMPEDFEMLKNTAERAQLLNPNLPETHLAMGTYLYWSDIDHERTLSHFETALQRFSNDSELHFKAALMHRRQANWDLLFKHLKEALEHDPLNVSLYAQLAWNYYMIRDYEKAVSYLDRLAELGFDETTSLPFAMVIRSINEDSFEVIEKWKDQIHPSDPAIEMPFFWGWYNRGKRDWDESLRSFNNIENEIIWSNETQYGLRNYWIAITLDRQGNRDEALAYYKKVKKHLEELRNEHPEEARYRTALGKVYARLGKYEKAIHEGEKAITLVPVSRNAATGALYELDLAEIYTWSNRKEQAIDKLEYTLSIPGHAHRILLRMDPRWDPLRDHPRFQELISGTDKPFMEDL